MYLTLNLFIISNLSIYQTSWIDLVFEDRNKDYGAYQLRKETAKTTFFALFCGFILVVLIASIPIILNLINGNQNQIQITKEIPKLTILANFNPKKPEIPKKAFVPPTKTSANKSIAKPSMNKPLVVDKINEAPVVPANVQPTTNNPDTSSNTIESGSNGSNSSTGENPSLTKIGVSTVLNRNELDKNPAFPGGIKVFLTYVGNNFRTPEIEMEQTVKVYVSFIVETDGSMSNIQVENDPGYGLGKEAIRVLKSLKTKWEAGQKDGQKVRTFYNLPISVELK